ncbi:MAG: polysaccharide biosynthesis/export family protein [Candidatus Eisenbacteria bacterium]|nr:polysaccharide biosynthesis/export family protein [Candidatus Eisenbacteria bacterium]
MKRTVIVFVVPLLIAFLCAGCGSRPGFEEDFTGKPESPSDTPTDEEILEAREQAREERLARLDELRQEELSLYVESEDELDLSAETPEYRIVARDNIALRFVTHPEMNLQIEVRPDGAASFDLLGDLPVAGMTPSELAETLKEMYAVYLREPDINVVVSGFASQKFYVLGEVKLPGEFELTNPVTITQAIAMAGSWSDDARTEDVMVIRMREDRTPIAMKVNVKEIMNGAIFADLSLRHMDVVYVPMGKMAGTRNFVGRFFDTILPPIDAAWKTAVLTGYRNR